MNDFGGSKGGFGKADFGKGKDMNGKGCFGKDSFDGGMNIGSGPSDFGKGPMDFGKGPSEFGKSAPAFGKGQPDFGKGGPDFGKGSFNKGCGDMNFGKGDFGKSDFGNGCGDMSFGKGDFGKGDFGKDNFGKGDFGKGDFSKGDFGKGNFGKGDIGKGAFGKADFGKDSGKGCGKDFSKGFDDFGSKGMSFDKGSMGKGDFVPPPMGMKGFDGKGMNAFDGKGMKGPPTGQVVPPPQGMQEYIIFDADQGPAPGQFMKGGPPGPGFQPPPPGGPPPPPVAPIMPVMNGAFAKAAPMPGGLAPELLALTEAENIAPPMQVDDGPGLQAINGIFEKKSRLTLLLTRLSPELKGEHMQQILEQCGDVQGWRRARDPADKPMSFGFAQFSDPEAAWKASTCMSKLVLCGMEVKVILEERTESAIQVWRAAQQAALKVNTTEELEWELERKSVDCKTAIDAKVEEIYGTDKKGGQAASKRRQELRTKESARILRTRKRKAWREAEFSKELERVESLEKRFRREEREKDGIDRTKEQQDAPKAKEDSELRIAKKEEIGDDAEAVRALAVIGNDARALTDLVDRIQSEPRDKILKVELDVKSLRDEKTLEKKLRPWLERKIDIAMGGPQSDLVEYVLRRVNAATTADALTSDLQRYLDENAEALVELMWRMLIFELMRDGRPMGAKSDKREEKGARWS